MRVLAVGTVGLDLVETPTESRAGMLGGSATYIALAASHVTNGVGLVAVVGEDFPEEYACILRQHGVDLSGLEVQRGKKTFAWGGRYGTDPNQRETLYTHLNVLAGFRPIIPEAYQACEILCLGNLDPVVQHLVLDRVPNAGYVVADTMNYWIRNTREDLERLLPRVDCLIINDEEACQLAAESSLLVAARKVHSMGPHALVVKKGEHGAMLFTGTQVFAVPAFPVVSIQDPTGAGDVFLGGFAGSLIGECAVTAEALRRAVIFGSVLASIAVESFGPYGLIDLSEESIARRLFELRMLAQFPEELSYPAVT